MSVKISPIGSFERSETKSLIDLYRVMIASRYQSLDVDDLDKNIGHPPYTASRKYDGELWYVICSGKSSKLVAANGRVLEGDHPILDAASKFEDGTIFAGELFVPSDSRERVGDVGKALANNGAGLNFAAFDLIREGESTFEFISFSERRDKVEALGFSGALRSVEYQRLASTSEIKSFFESKNSEGAEGIVVHSGDGRVSKIKSTQTIDVIIVGYTEREDGTVPEVRSLLLALKDEQGFTIVGSSGNFVQDVSRRALFEKLQPLSIPSEFKTTASSGQAYRMVLPELIIEVKALDVQSLDSRGIQIRQSTIILENGCWKAGPQIAAVQLIIPTGLRLREDKSVDTDGANWKQVSDFSPSHTKPEDLPKSTIIRRQVWTKTSGEKTDVRKLVVWKTNKDIADSNFPAYVVHWTDFSNGRKSPIDRDVKPAPSEALANTIADQMIDENIKKGWSEVV